MDRSKRQNVAQFRRRIDDFGEIEANGDPRFLSIEEIVVAAGELFVSPSVPEKEKIRIAAGIAKQMVAEADKKAHDACRCLDAAYAASGDATFQKAQSLLNESGASSAVRAFNLVPFSTGGGGKRS